MKRFLTAARILLSGLGLAIVFMVQAQSEEDRNLYYSPDHWPARWSSAVRQQEGSVFPDRRATTDQREDDFISDEDLFARPGRSRKWDELGKANDWQRIDAFDGRKFRERRDYRFNQGLALPPYGYPATGPAYRTMYPPPYYGAGPMGWDPVLGYGGLGYPPVGMPIVNYPYIGFPLVGGAYPGYYGAPGGFNYPFGPW
jgi:hypothetical protein